MVDRYVQQLDPQDGTYRIVDKKRRNLTVAKSIVGLDKARHTALQLNSAVAQAKPTPEIDDIIVNDEESPAE